MSSEGKFWVSCWAVVGATLVGLATVITIAGSIDDKLYKDAIDKGCSVIRTEHRGYNIYCGNVKEVNE